MEDQSDPSNPSVAGYIPGYIPTPSGDWLVSWLVGLMLVGYLGVPCFLFIFVVLEQKWERDGEC